jgi:glycerol-3-phosphate O-acyltransferase
MRPEDRERAKVEASSRVVDRHVEHALASADGYLETVINDTLYHERRRLDREARDASTRTQLAFYRGVQRRLRQASTRDLRALLDELTQNFADEIAGNFDERVYRVATRVIPPGLALLLTATSPKSLRSVLRHGLAEHIQIQGAVEELRSLAARGTVIVTPTHCSHLDSIVLGYAVHLLGLPPLLYGAGLNLFNNPLTSFFMNNLGAYRVDRKKSAPLYKEMLKEYATVAVELGYDNLFFPGGTRSRSGAIETHLKKGLLGTGIGAYVNNLIAARPKPDVWIVPCTISYQLVLEAETLIDDHLKDVGKARYIIEDDEFSRPARILNFLANIISLDGRIVLTFSEPLDVVGNRVDAGGHSLDPRGRFVDPAPYVMRNGVAVHDEQRDQEYTTELADRIVEAFLRDNVVMATHVVSRAALDILQRSNPELDLYRLLRTGGALPWLGASELAAEVDRLLATLRRLPRGPRLDRALERRDARAIIEDALRNLATYHKTAALVRRGEQIYHRDRNLLLYYSGRLGRYDLGRILGGRAAA